MRTTITAFFLGTLLCMPGIAQTTPPATGGDAGGSKAQPSTPVGQPAFAGTQPAASNQAQNNSFKIAPGSIIPVQLSKTVDAKKAKTGDEVVAMVTQDMKTNNGDVLVPKDTRILGHVTAAQARNKEQKASELGIAFDHAVVKGDQVQLPMSIQAVIAPQPTIPAAPDAGGTSQTPSSSNSTSPMAGRAPLSGSSQASQPQQNYPPGGGSSDSQSQTSAHPPITGNTRGVIGMPDVKLETTAQNAAQGSVMTSEKNNVKIEKGTMMLLRVN